MQPGESQSFPASYDTASYDTASYDTTTKIITAVVLFILIGVDAFTNAIVAGVGALVFALAYAHSPRGYAIVDRSIVVKRLIGNVRIPLDAIREVRSATRDDFRAALRLWGSGGLFGYYGVFQTACLGKSTWYITNQNRSVVVVTGSKTTLFSPDDVAGFITAIHEAVPVPQAHVAGPRQEPGRSFGLTGKLIGLGVAILAIAFVALAVLYAPGPPSYTLTSDVLTIHDRFYPVTVHASEVDIDQIRVIDFDRDTEWRPTLRTSGFANSHYQSGWFRVASGQSVRMYRAGGRRLVLLPPKGAGTPVLLDAADPDRLAAEIRNAWARGAGRVAVGRRNNAAGAACPVRSSLCW